MIKKGSLYFFVIVWALFCVSNGECALDKDFKINQEEAVARLQEMLENYAQEEAHAAYPREKITYVTVVDTTVLGESYTLYIIVHMSNKITIDLEMGGDVTYDQEKNGYWVINQGVRNVEYRKNGYIDTPPGIWEFGRN